MTVKLLLDAKREGRALAGDDIRALVAAYTRGEVPDYQMAAFAMAVCCRGMTADETFALTDAMRLSGVSLDWSSCRLPTADKHSTGGVGDKLSLIIQPLAASCGLAVPSLAGRGLGLTGGTVDKLESIPGFQTALTPDAFRKVVETCGVSIAAQTADIAPADKKLYALRDVTGTVPSVPLIVASILSKKLAEGAGVLVFDVKCGSGAFMKTPAEAGTLARALVAGAKKAGRKAGAIVTVMDEPLGRTIGNALEIGEALDVLRGASDVRDVVELSVEFAALMVAHARTMTVDEARALCRQNLADGRALAYFTAMVTAQGGDLTAFERTREKAVPSLTLTAPADGFAAHIDAGIVAQTAFDLGAGRAVASDAIDPAAGVVLCVTHGTHVSAGEPLARVCSAVHSDRLAAAAERLSSAFTFSSTPPPPRSLILERL